MVVAVGRENTASVVHQEHEPSRLTAPLATLAGLLVAFSLLTVFMVHDHAWTDSLTASVPLPGPATLAADPNLAAQMRVTGAHAWNTILADQTPAVVAEAEIANDALVAVRHIVINAEARVEGRTKAVGVAMCGKPVSNRLLGRIGRDELLTLLSLDSPVSVEPGHRLGCQVALAGIGPGIDEVVLRVASVEPFPGHPAPVFHPAE